MKGQEPAFPLNGDYQKGTKSAQGLTIRDYFAAKAMQGICSHFETWGLTAEEIVKRSYQMADAMIQERNKTNN